MNSSRFVQLLVFFVLLLFVGTNFAVTFVVNGTGAACQLGDTYYDTIQSAIDGAVGGETIIVCQNGSGEYLERVNVNTRVNISGNESGVRVRREFNPGSAFTVSANDVNVTNFTFYGASNTNEAGIAISGSGVLVYNVSSYDNYFGIYSSLSSNTSIIDSIAYSNYENFVISGNNLTIRNNLARDGTVFGFYTFYGLTNSTLVNNTVYNSSTGFYIGNTLSTDITNLTFINNTAYNNSLYGFRFQNSSRNNLSNNIAYNNTAGFLFGYSSYNNLANNLAHNNTESGMTFSDSSNNSITNNTAFNNTQYGFRFIASSGNMIANNTEYQSVNGFYLVSSSENNTLRNNIAYNNTDYGFVSTSDNTTFINNTAYSTSNVGFSLAYYRGLIVNNTAHGNSIGFQIGGGYHNISNNLAYDHGNYGFYLSYSSYNNLTNNTAYNSTSYGLYLYFNSNENRISNCSFYNNSYNIKLSKSSENNSFFNTHLYDASFSDIYAEEDTDFSSFYFSNVTIDNPLGNFENYTSLDIYDTLTATESYNLTWHQNFVSLPPERFSFANKFISISNESGIPAIDAINWTWLSSELSGYNESNFELWKYNETGWSRMNNSPDTTSNLLSFLNVDTIGTEYALLELNDSTAPLASIEYPTNEINLSTNESIELNFTVFDEGSYINSSTCKYYLDGDVTGVAISRCENTTFNVSSNIEGRHNISISVKDNSGKQGNSTLINFTIDKTPPIVNITSPADGYSVYLGSTIQLSVNVTDAITAISSVSANLSGASSNFSLVYDVASGLYKYSLSGLSVGGYRLLIIANDSSGNVNDSEYIIININPPPCTDCEVVTKEYIGWSSSTICPDNKIKITTEPNTRISLFYRPTVTSLSTTSNSEGIALFDPVGEGGYSITLSKEGFRTTEGDFSHTDCPPETNSMLISDEVLCPENQVKFTVLDDDEITALEGVILMFNGQEKATDSNGQAVFDLLPVNEELEIKAVTIEPIDLSNSVFYLVEATKEDYEEYSSIELIELCPPRNLAVSWAGICPSNMIRITVTDSESGAFVPGAEIDSYGTTGEDGTIQINKIPSATLNISKLGYIDYSNSFVFAYTCGSGGGGDDGNKTTKNETGGEDKNETKKEDKKVTDQPTDSNKKSENKEKITTTTNKEQSKTVSSGLISSDTINVLVNDANNVKQQITDYIFESEQGKKTASIAIVVVSVAGVFVYLRFVKKP